MKSLLVMISFWAFDVFSWSKKKGVVRAQVRDELEQLLDDDGDMAELFLTRKLPSPVGDNLSAGCPTLVSRLSRVSRASVGTYNADDDVEELEMLLEVGTFFVPPELAYDYDHVPILLNLNRLLAGVLYAN